VLRRIFGCRRKEITAGWRKLHNEKLYDMYCSPDVTSMIKSRKMRWARHVAHDEHKMPAQFLSEDLKIWAYSG
jgi:hypothetical protein